MNYRLYLDVGGTTVDIQAYDRTGQLIFNDSVPGKNVRRIPDLDLFFKDLSTSIPLPVRPAMVFCAAAGLSSDELMESVHQAISKSFQTDHIHLISDGDLLRFHGLGSEPGAVFAHGTGSICVGMRKNGEPYRYGGYGYLADTISGRYTLGQIVLQHVVTDIDSGLNSAPLRWVKTMTGTDDVGQWIKGINPSDAYAIIIKLADYLHEKSPEHQSHIISIANTFALLVDEFIRNVLNVESDVPRIVLTGGLLRNERIRDAVHQNVSDVSISINESLPVTSMDAYARAHHLT